MTLIMRLCLFSSLKVWTVYDIMELIDSISKLFYFINQNYLVVDGSKAGK